VVSFPSVVFSVVIDRFNDERLQCKEQAPYAAYLSLKNRELQLRKAAFDVFDLHAAPEDMENANPRRIAKARDKLKKQLYSRRMKELLMLPSKPKEKAA
jgi:hypothetical protein